MIADREEFVRANAVPLVEALECKIARQRKELAALAQRCAALTAERDRLRAVLAEATGEGSDHA